MSDAHIKLGCLELAAQLLKPGGIYDADSVVKTATVLYTFTQTPLPDETQVIPADKPVQKKSKAKALDILS